MFLMDSAGPLALAAPPTCMISVAIECLSAVAPQVPTLWLLTRCARPAHQMPERTRLGPEQWLLQTWPISTYYYCASTRPHLNFTLIDSLSPSHAKITLAGSGQVCFMYFLRSIGFFPSGNASVVFVFLFYGQHCCCYRRCCCRCYIVILRFSGLCVCQCSGLYGSCSHQPLLLHICRNTLIKRHTSV